jgi:hypothetical protein
MVLTRRLAQEMARRAVREAGSIAVAKTSRLLLRAPEKLEALLDRKKDEYLEEALARADAFFQEKIGEVEQRVDLKVEEIQRRLHDEFLEEIRRKLRWMTFLAGGLALLGTAMMAAALLTVWFSNG